MPATYKRAGSGIIVVTAALLAGGCTMMNPPREDPVQLRLAELERRIEAIERILANGSLVELTMQMDELQRRTAELQGRAETLAYQAEGSDERQRDLYMDLDERIQELERGMQRGPGSAAATAAPGAGDLPVPGGTDRENYQAAFELLKEQRYEPAAAAFRQFLVTFPDSQLADNAQYWLAESYYVTDKFEDALGQFRAVIDRYPRSRKLPDALLKMGYCNYELKRWNEARSALTRVTTDFSDSTAARLAEQRLKRMSDEGH